MRIVICGVYGWYNVVSDKWYVGGSNDVWARCKVHEKELNRGTHNGPKLLRAWQKYGPGVWICILLEECECEVLRVREQYWIERFDSYGDGYNTLPHAKGPVGVKWSDERRQRTLANHDKLSKLFSEVQKKRWAEISEEERKIHSQSISEARLAFSKEKKEKLAIEAHQRWESKSNEEKEQWATEIRDRFAKMTAEQRSEFSKRRNITPEIKERQYQMKQCPHCGDWFKPMNYARWHGDRCKKNASK